MAISTNQKPTIYRNLYENTALNLNLTEHETSPQCCFNIGQRRRRWANIETPLGRRVRWDTYCIIYIWSLLIYTPHGQNVDLPSDLSKIGDHSFAGVWLAHLAELR